MNTRAQNATAPSTIDPRARLALTSVPSGAALYIDDQNTGLLTPCDYVVNLRRELSNVVELELKLSGFETYAREITLLRGETLPLHAELIDQRAILRITTTPPGAAVNIDGTLLDAVTPCEYIRDMGGSLQREMTLALTLADHEPLNTRVTLRRGEIVPFAATLKKVKSVSQPWAAPMVKTATSSPADIRVNQCDGAEMVWVSAGEFTMGSNDFDNERPAHQAHLDGYYIYKNEVTVAQYRQFCTNTKRKMPEAPSWGWLDNHPMVNVTWEDAGAYATWAASALPTEAEWEKAARGTDGRIFPWGNDWDAARCQCSIKAGDAGQTSPVGSFPAGACPYGCLDMAGNVWEWCADWYGEDYQQTAGQNPTGPKTGEARVLRGGSWDVGPRGLRAAFRGSYQPVVRNEGVGFRCVVRSPGP